MRFEDSLGICISFNNDGALLIERGMHDKAIQRLTSALQVCRRYCAKQPASSSRCSKNAPVRFDLDVLLKAVNFAAGQAKLSVDGYVHQLPLRIPKLLQDCDKSVNLVMAVVCFNLGIAYHVRAFNGEPAKFESTLKKALQVYKSAERMQRNSSKSTKALFQIALLNNIGHVFKSLNEVDLTRTYYNRLLSLIIYMISFKKTDASHYEEYLGFLLFKQRTCASAA